MATPAATAGNVARNLRQYAWGASAAAMLSAGAGLPAGAAAGMPADPLIELANAVPFIVSHRVAEWHASTTP